MRRSIPMLVLARLLLVLGAALGALPAIAQEKPRVWALVSAIGGEISVVRQHRGVGNSIDPYRRYKVPIEGAEVDAAVLRGLDRAVASEDPDSTRVLMRLSSEAIKGVSGYRRGDVLSGKAIAALEAHPDRASWHRIVLVTPRFLNPGRDGMGPRLHGIGLYIQPIGRGPAGSLENDIHSAIDPDTMSPTGEMNPSYRFVAPYFYAQVWVIDAKTLKVLETHERYDFQRLYDPDSLALDVAQSIPVEVLAPMMETFIERAGARALHDRESEVTIKEPRVVDPAVRK